MDKSLERILWSIALPGFAQFLNGKIIKGSILIFFEFLINIQSNLNVVIISSFHGRIAEAIEHTDYQWLMFYPCIYLFAIWDAYRDSGGGKGRLSYLPFVFSAYIGTIGVIYSSTLKIMGVLLGPIWLSILFLILGFLFGALLRLALIHIGKRN
jgi:hypothetical protein